MKAKVDMEPSVSRKYASIGAYLRSKKKLGKNDSTFVCEDLPPKKQKFLSAMAAKGLKLNKVSLGAFKMKNGAQYSGFYAKEDINPDDIIMQIPRSLLITAQNAWMSPLKQIFLENPDYFTPTKTTFYYQSLQFILDRNPDYYCPFRHNDWEFRMILFYFLYEHSKGKDSEWFDLFECLPTEFDTASFWPDDKLELLEDKAMIRLAKLGRRCFEDEAKQILEIASKYPTILKSEYFTYEKIKWLYICFFTRHYEEPLEYLTYVPIGEFFNHERMNTHEFLYDEAKSTHGVQIEVSIQDNLGSEEKDDGDTTDGTYGSLEHDNESDFEYEKGTELIKTELNSESKALSFKSGEESDKIEEILRGKLEEIYDFLENKLDWGDPFTIFYVKEIYSHLERSKESVREGKVSIDEFLETVANVTKANSQFQKEAWRYYQDALNQDPAAVILEQFESQNRENKKTKPIPSRVFTEDQNWDTKSLGFKAGEKIEKEAQLYLYYGRMSNRYLLVNYGAALEYNKYDNVHFKIPYFGYLDENARIIQKIQDFKMSKFKKFKVRRRKFSIELLNFYKATAWRYSVNTVEELIFPRNLGLELKALDSMKTLYEDFFKNCKSGEDELALRLKDPSIDYREYFATVLNLERQRCVRFHYKAVLVLIEILKRLKSGSKLDVALLRVDDCETAEQCPRNRAFFKKVVLVGVK